jgi:hypothetical protein
MDFTTKPLALLLKDIGLGAAYFMVALTRGWNRPAWSFRGWIPRRERDRLGERE